MNKIMKDNDDINDNKKWEEECDPLDNFLG